MAPTSVSVRTTRTRWLVLTMIFIVSTLNYASRATLSIAGPAASKQLGIDAKQLGYLFSAFGWTYVIAQVPGGWLLDRFGSRNVYAASVLLWSVFTFLQGYAGAFGLGAALMIFFMLRLLLGLAEAPAFPANSRIVAAWFPAAERGTAAAVFNSSQYFATFLFAPLSGWITHEYGWPWVFYVTGGLGIVMAGLWMKTVYSPATHPRVSAAELDFIEKGGALTTMDKPASAAQSKAASGSQWSAIWQLLSNPMMLGIYLGQYCITTITVFFATWFPVYLVQERHMSILKAGFTASLPALCGFAGGILGGVFSDALLRRGSSLTVSRKVPIVAGMLLSTSMILCNFVASETMVVVIMSLAFLGKGIGALGWAVVADTTPKQIAGLSGGLFNMFGNVTSIITPIVIGYIVDATHSYKGALIFVAANAAVAIFSYLVIVGEIRRVELKTA
ncbi:MAG TPA: MFS transporter [Bryobacteraceae bacterium]|nr:MFS transporter [Bryobacteraceae bacterium]